MLDAVLPLWPLPLKDEVNPALPALHERHLAWLDTHRLTGPGQRLARLRVHDVVAYAFPSADLEVLALVADWTGWFFHFDDFFDEGAAGATSSAARQLADYVRHSSSSPPSPSSSLPEMPELPADTRRAYVELIGRSRPLMTPPQWDQFTAHLDAYFDALCAEAANRERREPPTLADYCRIRRFTGPAPPQIDLIEHSESVRLPHALYGTAPYQELIDATADISSWINDVFSAAKEHAAGDMHNLVLVLQRENSTTVPQAAALAVEHITARLTDMSRARTALEKLLDAQRLPAATREAAHRWVAGLYRYLHHAAWYLGQNRYATAGARP